MAAFVTLYSGKEFCFHINQQIDRVLNACLVEGCAEVQVDGDELVHAMRLVAEAGYPWQATGRHSQVVKDKTLIPIILLGWSSQPDTKEVTDLELWPDWTEEYINSRVRKLGEVTTYQLTGRVDFQGELHFTTDRDLLIPASSVVRGIFHRV